MTLFTAFFTTIICDLCATFVYDFLLSLFQEV